MAFKIHKGICSCGCGKEGIVCVKKGYIIQCNERIKKEKKHKDKSTPPPSKIFVPKTVEEKQEIFNKLKEKFNAKQLKQKQNPHKPLKRTPLKKKFPKPTGERELFLEIWEERPHYCTNKDCQEYLGEEPLTHYFAHLKSKGAHNELRLDKDNIALLCFDCHYIYDNGDRSKIIIESK